MTTTHHLEYLPDRAAMGSIRLMLLPMKGSVDDPSAREPFDHLMANTPAAPGIAYKAASIGGVPGWWCLPGDATPHSAILYFHGGGYVVGSARAYRHFAGHFAARANVCAFVPDYALAPERPFPAAIDDAGASYAGLVAQGFSKIALAGDSAGGGLALAALSQAVAQSRAGAWPRPKGAAVISASTDLALTGESMEVRADADPLSTRDSLSALASLYLAGHDPRDPLASPLYGDLVGLPPVMMHVGEDDILLDDSIRYAERLEREGGTAHLHTWAGMFHVFPSNLTLQAANEALDSIGNFLRQQLSRDAQLLVDIANAVSFVAGPRWTGQLNGAPDLQMAIVILLKKKRVDVVLPAEQFACLPPVAMEMMSIRSSRRGDCAMARTYREVAKMLETVEEAMHRVINRWGDMPPPMKEAIEQFRTQLGAAIDSVEFVKRALAGEVHETELRLDQQLRNHMDTLPALCSRVRAVRNAQMKET